MQRYLGILETSYGLLTKLQTGGFMGVLARWMGM